MCRCCQNCWENIYWYCFEEKFCYDESIANYNPDEDQDYVATQKNGSIFGHVQASDNNNLTVPSIICDQPLGRGGSGLLSHAKIHEEDLRRETQTNVPMLGPEILAVFANSQIFQDHQPTKLNRIATKSNLAGVHSPKRDAPTTPRESEQDRLLRRLEGHLSADATDSSKTATAGHGERSPERHITFTITGDSSPEDSQIWTPKKFDAIAEEDTTESKEVILRPRLIDRHPHLLPYGSGASGASTATTPRKILRNANSVPHLNVRSAASETDIFSITGSGAQISMTPEVPSISFSNLPKNYEDTPTIEKYRVSQSLYSIQTANEARVLQDDFSMPRYFRRSPMATQSNEMLAAGTASPHSATSLRDDTRRPEKSEKSKRLQMLRSNLPPLLIHSVSFKKVRDEGKQLD